MDSVQCQFIVDDVQQCLNIGLVEKNGQYFVENPIKKNRVFIRLDATRLEKPSKTKPGWIYKGILFNHKSLASRSVE
jgi:hypothetical protein